MVIIVVEETVLLLVFEGISDVGWKGVQLLDGRCKKVEHI